MGVTVRLADPIADRLEIIAGLHDHLNPLTDGRRFDWLYKDNPDGPARIWVIEDVDTSRIVGSSSLLPRRFLVDGREALGCVVADTWVHPDFRVLGPAVKLQRACVEDVRAGNFVLGYDFPRQAMPAIYKRLEISPVDSLCDFVRLLQFDSYLANRISNRAIASLATGILNPLSRFMLGTHHRRDLAAAMEVGRCGQEFTTFHKRVAGNTICVARTAEFLNWRYLDHFHKRHELFVARRHGSIAGYAVVVADPPHAEIIDIVCEQSEGVALMLISALLAELTERGCQSASYSTLSSGRLVPLLRRSYFRKLSETPFVIITSSDSVQTVPSVYGEFAIGQEAD